MPIDDRVPLGDREALTRRLPPADLELRAGVRAPVRIARDGAGVPHVYASHARDLFLGWGLAVAQDRLWQLDYFRRRARGRLAEVLGPEAVASDRLHRLLDFAGLAEAEWRAMDAESKEALDGFTAGINAWMERAASAGVLPIEFEVLTYAPEPWRPTDTIALQRAFLWQLTGRIENLAAAELAHRVLGEPLATDFLRTESPDEIIMPGGVDARSQSAAATGGGDTAGGSNNWAVSPARSASGRALLASDPHLPFQLPTGLHLVHVSGAGYDATGAAYPGWPVIWMGHNDRIAWGMTNLVSSARDVYVEQLDPADRDRYRDGAGWARVEHRAERIAVRGAAAVDMEVRSTRRGPLVDEILPALPGDEPTARSLRWVGQEPLGDLRAGLDLLRARDWTSFRRAVASWSLPIVNVLYADADGHIGWQGVGCVPVRGTGDATRGYRLAGDPAHEWTGVVPFESLPRALDPARGWLASANNRPVPDGFPTPLYGWWAPGHRAVRLRQLLDTGATRFSADDFRRIQSDAYSVRAEQLLPALRRRLSASTAPAARRVLALLEGWDCHCGPESAAPAVFETLFEHWHARVLQARFPRSTQRFLVALGAGSGLALRLLSEGSPAGWFAPGALEAELDAAAQSALAELEQRLGPDSSAWRWGALHTVSFRHPLAGRPGLEALFATPAAPVAGTSHAINNNVYAHGATFAVVLGPELRFVVDFADVDGAAMVLTTGQSGQPGSAHYLDHLALWLRGEHARVPFSPDAVDKATTATTRISPRP